VVRVDLRGHGRSEAPPTSYGRDEFAKDVATLMERLRLRNAVVVGHSMGGMIAPEVARLQAERTAGLVLVDSGLGWQLEGAAVDAHAYLRGLEGDDWQDWLVGQLTGLAGLGERPRPELRARIARDALKVPKHVVASSIRNAVLTVKPRPSWSRLRMPVLYLCASNAYDTPERVRRIIRNAELGRAVGSGHWLQLEVQEQFNAMLRDFVSRLP